MRKGKNNFYQSKTFTEGIIAEFFVMDFFEGRGCETDNSASYPQSDKHHDLDVLCDKVWKSAEVKVAYNKKNYPTHFAEIISTKSMWYAEYLVFPPDIMIYCDTANYKVYLYDGKTFVNAVKQSFCDMFPNYDGSAYGIKFGKKSKEFGFVSEHCIKDIVPHTISKNEEKIQHRLLASKDVYVSGFRECDGLPNLNKVFNLDQPCPEKKENKFG